MAGFRVTGALGGARRSFAAVLLDDGRVLVAGGSGADGSALRSTEVYDPATEVWIAAGSLHGDHVSPQLVATAQGAVLVGNDPAGADALLETWDAASGMWTAHVMEPAFAAADAAHGSDGDLYVYSGARSPLDPLGTSRFVRVDLPSRTAEAYPPPGYDRTSVHLVSLADGRVLVAAGIGHAIGAGGGPVEYVARTSEVFDFQSWKPTGRLAVPHVSVDRWNPCLVALSDGDALIVAGSDEVDTYTDVVERFSGTTGGWTRREPLPDARDGHTTTRLPGSGDTVLVIGGENAGGVRADGYSYDAAADAWSPIDAMITPRTGHVAIAFSDRRMLVVGGADDGSCEILE